MKGNYTKAQLEQLVYGQLEKINALHNQLDALKHKNLLLGRANTKLKNKLAGLK